MSLVAAVGGVDVLAVDEVAQDAVRVAALTEAPVDSGRSTMADSSRSYAGIDSSRRTDVQ